MTSAVPFDSFDPGQRVNCTTMRNGTDRFADQTLPYLLGKLDAGETSEFEAHLSECLLCTEEVSRLHALTAQVTSGVLQRPSPS